MDGTYSQALRCPAMVESQASLAAAPWLKNVAAPRAFVIVNESAGSVGRGAGEKLGGLLEAAGISLAEMVYEVGDLSACRAKADGADMIVVLGGDGTARAAAEAFAGGPPLILLPGGTLNVLPRALYGDRAWPDALEAVLREGRIRRLVGGTANGRPFFVAALFGAPTLLARARESAREGRFVEAVARARHAFKRLLSRSLMVQTEREPLARAMAVGVLCPSYVGEIEDNALEWVRLDAQAMTDFFRVSLRSVLGGWREDPSIELSRAVHGDIRSRGVVPAVLDGEPATFVSRVRVRIVKDGPRVVALD